MAKIKSLLFLLFCSGFLPLLGADSTGIWSSLNKCYELNKKRDISLISTAKQLIPIAKDYPKSDVAVRVYTLAGRGFMNSYQFDSSIIYYLEAEKNLSAKVSPDAKGKLMIAFGWNYYQVGRENIALTFNLRALDFFKEAKDSTSMANALANLASMVDALGQFDKGLAYKKQALEIYLLKKDTLGVLKSLNNIANNYMFKEEYEIGISYLNQALQIGKNYDNTSIYTIIYKNLGFGYLSLGKYDESEKIGDKILDIHKNLGAKADIGEAFMFKAISSSEKNNRALALRFADSSMAYLKLKSDIQHKDVCYRNLVTVYSKYKIFDKALNASLLRDSILTILTDSSNAQAFAKKEFKFELSNSKAELESLKEISESQALQVQSQRQIIGLIIGIVAIFLSAFLLTFYLFRKSKLAEKAIQAQNLVVANQNLELKKQNELQLMTIGIVGHDLRGPLASAITLKEIIISMLEAGQIKEAMHFINLHFNSLDRIHILANNLVQWVLSAQSGINLNFEMVVLYNTGQNLIQTFETDLKAKQITIINSLDPALKVYADPNCVETILRNIVQNAVKFTENGKNITISAESAPDSEGLIKICVEDEGVGMPPEIIEKLNEGKKMITLGTQGERGNGLGLIMIQTLLSLNRGKMEVVSEIGKGTKFFILLPSSVMNDN